MVASSISTGTATRPPSDVALLVPHGRHLSQVSVSTVDEFTAAVANSTVNKIWLAAGTYKFTNDMVGCPGSAVCINRVLTIEAERPGAVVFNAMEGRRVFKIQANGTAELIGLNITGGNLTSDVVLAFLNPSRTFLP